MALIRLEVHGSFSKTQNASSEGQASRPAALVKQHSSLPPIAPQPFPNNVSHWQQSYRNTDLSFLNNGNCQKFDLRDGFRLDEIVFNLLFSAFILY